jgi:hypothetical protein
MNSRYMAEDTRRRWPFNRWRRLPIGQSMSGVQAAQSRAAESVVTAASLFSPLPPILLGASNFLSNSGCLSSF